MKKSLFALAAVTAFAGAAQAQSSVTVYGIIDAGYIGSNTREGAVKTQRSAFGQSAETTSRLGFRGNEDLGGGMSAFFTVEFGLTPQNSNLSGGTAADTIQATNQNGGSAIDNRQSFVGLKKNGIGQFAFGRQYTTVFTAGATTSPGQYNNVVGDVVYAGGAHGTYAAASTSSGTTTGLGYTNRASNAVTLQTDRFGGLVLSAFAAMNNQDVTQTATAGTGTTNWGGMGVGADFRWKKLIATAAYQSFTTDYATGQAGVTAGSAITLGGQGPTTRAFTGTSTAAVAVTDTTDKQTLVGAVYDFGILKAYAQWVGRKVNVVAGEQINRNAQQLGVRANITPQIETWASIGNGRIKSSVNAATANFTGYQLGANYILSKRTNMYGIFGSTVTSNTSASVGGYGANQYAVGVRHTF
jgi:predicted porin